MDVCHGCGLRIDGGTEACQELFDTFRVREAAELAPSYRSTRLTIDVFCLQHPDRYCASAKSLAAHLTGVCWALERGGDDGGLRALQRWLDGRVELEKPPIPELHGELTIADVSATSDRATYLAALDRWARSTWDAYSAVHATARHWVDQAFEETARPRLRRGRGCRAWR